MVYIKELADVIMGAGKLKICKAVQQAGNSGKKRCCHFESKICGAGQQSGNLGRSSIL